MKPKPFSSLNHLTVPVAMLLSPSTGVLSAVLRYAEVADVATICVRHCGLRSGKVAVLTMRRRCRSPTGDVLAVPQPVVLVGDHRVGAAAAVDRVALAVAHVDPIAAAAGVDLIAP